MTPVEAASVHGVARAIVGVIVALALSALQAAAQAPGLRDAFPEDAFRDPGAARLVARARAARGQELEGVRSYDATMTERLSVGFRGAAFRRERGLFQQERIARIHWSRDGDRTVRWLGARSRVPMVGIDSQGDEDLRRDLVESLSREATPAPLSFEPGDDRLVFGDSWAVHPLSDSAGAHYRYASGDTLLLTLPDGRTVTMIEARVEPRRADVHLVAGSLWFDGEGGSLVRASYRPARAFDLSVDEPEDAEDVPDFLEPIRAEVYYITVDYGLHELRWWLPRRFAFEGELQLGRFLRIPATFEWTVRDYRLNVPAPALVDRGRLPPGWTRSERAVSREGQPTRYVTVVTPPPDALSDSPLLSDPGVDREAAAFSDAEIRELRRELEQLVPLAAAPRPRVYLGLENGMLRFNRVEGLSLGVATEVDLAPPASLYGEARIGVADLVPRGEVALWHGGEDRRVRLGIYRRLDHTSDWNGPFTLASSLANLVMGWDRADYFRTQGGELALTHRGRWTTRELRLFGERQAPARRETSFHLLKPVTNDTLDANVAARAGTVGGLSGSLRWFVGVDPRRTTAFGRLWGETAWGDFHYRRLAASVGATRPLAGGLAGALELAVGAGWGDPPPQRAFYLGGHSTLRGFDTGSVAGESFWLARAELGGAFPGARIAVFGDLGWAGPRRDLASSAPRLAAGVGASALDGIFRLDLAWAVRGGSGFRLHAYVDGLF